MCRAYNKVALREGLGEQEVAEGAVRMAVAEAAAERSQELAMASDALAAKGVDELLTAEMAVEVAREAAAAGVAEIAEGAETLGAARRSNRRPKR